MPPLRLLTALRALLPGEPCDYVVKVLNAGTEPLAAVDVLVRDGDSTLGSARVEALAPVKSARWRSI